MNDRELRLRQRIDDITDRNHELAAENAAVRVELEHQLAELDERKAELRKTRSKLRERTMSRDLWKLRCARLRLDPETRVRERRRLEGMVGRLTRPNKDAA